MKRLTSAALAGALALTLCACGADQPVPTAAPPSAPSSPAASQSESGGQTSGGKILIVYFTADENREVDAVTSASLTTQTIQELEPGANVVTDGFTVNERNVAEAAADVDGWLKGLGV